VLSIYLILLLTFLLISCDEVMGYLLNMYYITLFCIWELMI